MNINHNLKLHFIYWQLKWPIRKWAINLYSVSIKMGDWIRLGLEDGRTEHFRLLLTRRVGTHRAGFPVTVFDENISTGDRNIEVQT